MNLDTTNKSIRSLLLFLVLCLWALTATSADTLHHQFNITLSPSESAIQVRDEITLVTAWQKPEISFLLHGNMTVTAAGNELKNSGEISVGGENKSQVPLTRYLVRLNKGQQKIRLDYHGKINDTPTAGDNDTDRSGSPGLIVDDGVFLSRATGWYPVFEPESLVTFDATITLPKNWLAVSQGQTAVVDGGVNKADNKAANKTDDISVVRWREDNPQDDIYLVAGQFRYYTQGAGSAQAMVYLRSDDEGLAQKYLDVTAQYLSLYSKLLGPYPYNKFALVENFLETGYGMPSFTLLGPTVIRFPFILHSSYPHEILHNWWGNSVYVDYDSGNWAEGLTAYLADHLVKEQRGLAANHRRSVLQKYTDYVSDGLDFPLTEFRSRHSAVTEAVGYGKTLMLFHMLRQQVGDEDFVRALRRFYRANRFRTVGFSDVEQAFADAAGYSLKSFFEQWVTRIGAPALQINSVTAVQDGSGYKLDALIEQHQPGVAYQLNIPVAIRLQGEASAFQAVVTLSDKQQTFSISLPAQPLRFDLDPEFDLFRRLDSEEIPAALSQGFGADNALLLLPSAAPAELQAAYKTMALTWQKEQAGKLEIKYDNDVATLPADRAVWLLGWRNKYLPNIGRALSEHAVSLSQTQVKIGKQSFSSDGQAVMLAARNPDNRQQTLLWLGDDNAKALPGLTRKLPHYRKYSYLAFDGDGPDNIAKGQWPVIASPMSVMISKTAASLKPVKLMARQALAELPPVFSEKRMLADIDFLASEKMQGRGLGSASVDKAADYIAAAFREAGLQPGGDQGREGLQPSTQQWTQQWTEDVGKPPGKIRLQNVIAVLPGTSAAMKDESIIISAHYDHLGTGWPDAHAGDEGKVHYGADDNASGIAVLLELARQVAKKWQPERSIVFIAFTGEEAGHRGSTHYANSLHPYPVEKIFAVLNLDTVGRLGDQPVTIFGTGSASEMVHIFRGAGFVTGIDVRPVPNDFGASDQKPFLAKGIPAVQLFATAHSDFHRPTDTVDRIDSAGLIKVATILKEGADYLANRKQPLTLAPALIANRATKPEAQRHSPSGRKVSLGTIPDFTWQGEGVRIDGVMPGSPAAGAGLQQGDILLELRDRRVTDLAALSAILKSLTAAETVTLRYLRAGKPATVSVTVVAR